MNAPTGATGDTGPFGPTGAIGDTGATGPTVPEPIVAFGGQYRIGLLVFPLAGGGPTLFPMPQIIDITVTFLPTLNTRLSVVRTSD